MQVSFLLRKDKINKDGLIPVRMLITFGGQRIRREVKGVKVLEKHWKKADQRIKPSLKSEEYNYHIEYNKILEEQNQNVKQLFRYILLNNIKPTKQFIADKLDSGLESV